MNELELREELRQIDEDLVRMRQDVVQMRREIGERWGGPTDAAEMATVFTNVEQQEALIEDLEIRRRQVLRRLGED